MSSEDIDILGTAVCKEEIVLSVWDGSNDTVNMRVGEELIIVYFEHDGTIGLDRNGVELCCSLKERKSFDEKWDD